MRRLHDAARAFLRKGMTPARVIVMSFAAMVLLGTILLTLPFAAVRPVTFQEAFFTAASSVCVTGLLVVDIFDTFTVWGQLIILVMIQIGGIGFMTMATLLLILLGKRISLSNRLIMMASLNENHLQGMVKLTKWIVMMTLCVEGIGAAVFAVRFIPHYGLGKGLFVSVFHAVSSFCNAGMDLNPHGQSLAAFSNDPIVLLMTAVLIIVGGLGFSVILDVITHKRFARFSLHTKVVLATSAGLLALSTLFFLFIEGGNPDTIGSPSIAWWMKPVHAFFEATTLRTAGFSTFPQGDMLVPSRLISFPLMLIGASPASTGGGIKITTMMLVLLSVAATIQGRDEHVLFRRSIAPQLVRRSMAILFLSVATVMVGVMLISSIERYSHALEPFGHDFETLLYECMSAFSTVGTSHGITAALSQPSRLVLIVLMFMGRLGPLTLAFAFAVQSRKRAHLKYPEDRIMVG